MSATCPCSARVAIFSKTGGLAEGERHKATLPFGSPAKTFPNTDAAGTADIPFPLTPALSLPPSRGRYGATRRERENHFQSGGRSNRSIFCHLCASDFYVFFMNSVPHLIIQQSRVAPELPHEDCVLRLDKLGYGEPTQEKLCLTLSF